VSALDVVTARSTELDRYAALARTTGIIGIAFLVLLFGPIIALSVDEPPLDATAAEAVKNFGNLEATWAQLTMAASTLGMIGSLWFFVAFGFLLRRAEGDPPWRSAIATLSGALLAAFGLIGVSSTYAASLHGGRITPEVADYAYAFGSVGFANIWIALASFAVCSGWVILSTGVLERWMGWWMVVAGLCLVVARFVWRFWGVGYALFWLWIIVVCIRLIVRPDRWGSAAR
jgi:hypothetical protein